MTSEESGKSSKKRKADKDLKSGKKSDKKSGKKSGKSGGKKGKKGKDQKNSKARKADKQARKEAKKARKNNKKGGSFEAVNAPQAAVVSDFDDHLNRSLDDVIGLLEQEIERLKVSLETYRLSNHPDRIRIVRWHVRTLDERQDTLEDLRSLIMAERQGKALH